MQQPASFSAPTIKEIHRVDLDRLADKIFGPEPLCLALTKPAPSREAIDDPTTISQHEWPAVRIYEYSRESKKLLDAVKKLKAFYLDPRSRKKREAAERACYSLSDIRRLLSTCLARTGFPRPWTKLIVAERQSLVTQLPAQIHLLRKALPLNILDASGPEASLSPHEWQTRVIGPVGEGPVCFGFFATNLAVDDDGPILEIFRLWLTRKRRLLKQWDRHKSTRKTGHVAWDRDRAAFYQVEELRLRHDAKQNGLTFRKACEKQAQQLIVGDPTYNCKARRHRRQSDSDAACKAAIDHFHRLFGDSEVPIHHDWQKTPAKAK